MINDSNCALDLHSRQLHEASKEVSRYGGKSVVAQVTNTDKKKRPEGCLYSNRIFPMPLKPRSGKEES